MARKMDRDDDEAKIASGLDFLFADTREDLDRGRRVNWDTFNNKAVAAIRPTLEEVFAVVFLLLIIREGTASGSALWARQQSTQIATSLTARMRGQIEGGAEPSRVLTNGRASSVAATEVTRAISAGERAAREANARDAPRAPDGPPGPPEPTKELPRSLAIRDGLVSTWNTEEDERVCPICNPLDGLREEAWIREFPFGPPAHPQCRCWLTYEDRG